ncbi:hypothetical protein LCGC14_1762250 [marine sediment metagenome]|uniref:Uncharacterized protein n=1 Tax=marine sediment metagenome TaxID=412755 RepID=A0A0F9H0R5_9ZZZZ
MIRDWFRKLCIRVQFRLEHHEWPREVFTWHDRLFILGERTLYEIFEGHNGETVMTCRTYLDPEFNLESYMEHG